VTEDKTRETEDQGVGLQWPPSPKTQIILIALAFGLLNVILLAVWVIAIVMSR
jgi:hypothetical protein